MNSSFLVLCLAMLSVVTCQLAGTQTGEVHPSFSSLSCTAPGVCTSLPTTVTLDANWRWLHNSAGQNCYTGNNWIAANCPNPTTCASNCALEGVDTATYQGTYGITSQESGINLKFVTQGPYSKNIGSRVYLMASDTSYQVFKLLNQEIAFDVDVSNLLCGLNGAVYFVEMDGDGGLKYPGNKAGAKFGTGYCDAQCPQDIKFINGEANTIGWTPAANDPNSGTGQYGTCCQEMDLWEANSISTAYTPHPCTVTGQTRCLGNDCGAGDNRYNGVCDRDGCDFNSFRMGDKNFYGPGKTVDTTKPLTLVTQFITADGTSTGALTEIKRFYKQNNVVIQNSATTFPILGGKNSLTDSLCNAQKSLFNDTNDFAAKGGMAKMGQALGRGMVLAFSLWDDHLANCLWLDSNFPTNADPNKPGVARGTCPITSGVPAEVEANFPNANVKFSNLRFGALGSTTAGVPAPGGVIGTATGSQSSSAGSASGTPGGSTTGTAACVVGSESCACTSGGGCDPNLTCLSKVCVSPSGIQTNNAGKAQIYTVAFVLSAFVALLVM